MTLSRGMAQASFVIGFALLGLAFGCVACGAFAMSKLHAGVSSTGLWAIYYLLPGVMLLVAGFRRYFTVFAIALGANVSGIILSMAGVSYAVGVWIVLNSDCGATLTVEGIGPTLTATGDKCICVFKVYDDEETSIFNASCSDLETVRDAYAAVALLYALLLIVSVVGSILGCFGACCGNRGNRRRRGMASPPYVMPSGDPNTMMMTTLGERRNFDNDPYNKQARYVRKGQYIQEAYHKAPYIEETPYLKREPLTEERPYSKRELYTEERPYPKQELYTEEIPYPKRERYTEETPYPKREPYTEETPYSKREPYTEERPYSKRELYTEERPYPKRELYTEETPYPKREPYTEETPYSKREPYTQETPYSKRELYTEERPYSSREPYTKERPYSKRETRTEERPYIVEERHYHSDRGYLDLQEYPSDLPPRSLPTREGHHLFAGYTNESFDRTGNL
ncbi:Hypothetical predicted protein [Paramuricea clavata]|uniref:Uncharacterized protein n=1 Tax=Paramuricea clavata TaxID=317549 RepID=A0A6S7GR33_PARCT|nr:Hypothetical predicted protein [Paramuricea clavata]